MVQPVPAAGDRALASPVAGGRTDRPRVLEKLRARAAETERMAQSASWLESILEWARSLLGPPILRHGIAALRRGNLDAAFALLREEVAARPDRPESTLLFWEVALSCERVREAGPPMARLVQNEVAQGKLESAADHWVALVGAVPEVVLEVGALVRILPELRARIAQARGEAAQRDARECLIDALRRSVDPERGALAPALALRIVDEARGFDLEVAQRAAQAALAAPGLHDAKRTRLQELLHALERGEWPDAPATAASAASPRPAPPRSAAPRQAAPRAPAQKPQAPAQRAAAPAKAPPKAEAKTPPKESAPPAPKADARPKAEPRAAARPASPRPAPEEKSTAPRASGRRTVALTDNEIEAASSRLAERMAPHPSGAAAPAPLEPAPAQATDEVGALEVDATPDAGEPDVAEPQFLDEEDVAFGVGVSDAASATPPGGESEAVVLSDDDVAFGDSEAVLEVDPEAADAADLEVDSLDAELEVDGDAPLEVDEASGPLRAEPASSDFEFGVEPEIGEPAIEAEIEEPEYGEAEKTRIGSAVEAPADLPDPEKTVIGKAVSLEPPAPPAALRTIDMLPVELGADGLVAFEVAHAQRTRIDYRAIEAVAAAEVEGLAAEPILVVELVLRARAGRPRSALRMRADAFDAAALYPDHTDSGQALRAMLADLLERTRAVPLPDPDSALAIQPQRFESLTAFEAAVVARLAG